MKKLLMTILIFMYHTTCQGFESAAVQFPQTQFQSVSTLTSVTGRQFNITPVGASITGAVAAAP